MSRLMKDVQQQQASEQRGLPVEVVSDSQSVRSVSEASVAFSYYNAGVLTADAGQSAGTVVVAKLTQGGVLTAVGDVLGGDNDTSLAFTSTAFTSRRAFPYWKAEQFDDQTGTSKASAITSGFANGDYCIDHRTGTLYGVKASNQTTLTSVTYKVSVQTAGGSSAVSLGTVQSLGATTTSSGTVVATNGAGGTQIVAANTKRAFTQCQNNGTVDVYFGTGTVTSSFLKVVPAGTFTWHSQEALKVLSSGVDCNIAYTDYINS